MHCNNKVLILVCFALAITRFVVATDSSTGWAVGIDGLLLKTTNGGTTWSKQGQDVIPRVELQGLSAYDAKNAWCCGVNSGGYGGIYRTTDGDNWVRSGSASDVPDKEMQKLHAISPDLVWVSGTGGVVLLTKDGGSSWQDVSPPAGTYSGVDFQGIWALSDKIAWVGGTKLGDRAVILKTVDGGSSWVRQQAGGVSVTNHILGIASWGEDLVWAVGGTNSGGYAVLKSINGGANWTHVSDVSGLTDANEVYVVSDKIVYVAVDYAVYKTTDAGVSWTKFSQNPYTMGVCSPSSDGSIVYASVSASNGSIFYSGNGGLNWTQQYDVANASMPGVTNIFFPYLSQRGDAGVIGGISTLCLMFAYLVLIL